MRILLCSVAILWLANAAWVGAQSPSPDGAAPIRLFNGTNLDNWSKVEFPYFQVEGGYLVCQNHKGSRIIYADRPVEGDFDIRMEARLLEEHEGDPLLSLMLYGTGPFDYISLGFINRKAYFLDRTSESEKQVLLKKPAAELKVPFVPEQ